MPITREIPTPEWEAFLHDLSEKNQGRPVRLEADVRPGEGEQLLAEHQPLLGVDLDTRGSEAPSLTITLGGLNPEMPQFEHVIADPKSLWVEEEAGRPLALQVEAKDGGKTRLLFEREQALPG